MGNFDSATVLILAGVLVALAGAGYSIKAGIVNVSSSPGGGGRSLVAVGLGLVLITVGILLKAGVWSGSQGKPISPAVATPTSSPPAVTPSPTTTTEPSPAAFTVTLRQPTDGERLPITGGIATGTTTGSLGESETLWLMIASEGTHYVTGEITLAADGTFSLATGQLGSRPDTGLPFVIEIIRANPTATKTIDNLPANPDGDRLFKRLPPGTTAMATKRIIRA